MTGVTERFDPSKIDVNSPTWKQVERYVDQQLRIHYKNLKQCGLPDDETENARGAIQELETMLEVVRRPHAVQADEQAQSFRGLY